MTASLLKSTTIVGGMTTLSRVLGFVRDTVIARALGAGMGADAFFVAFRIPNLLRRLFAEGAFAQAFIPVLVEYRARDNQDEVRRLMDQVTGRLSLVLMAVTVMGILIAPLLVWLFAPGFGAVPGKHELTVTMLRITFPYVLFISLTALGGAILNTYGRFGVPAFTPAFLNLAMIGAALWLAPHLVQPAEALAWGVCIGGVAQLLFVLPFLARIGLLPRPRLRGGHEGLGRMFRLMLPSIFGSSVAQINLLVNTVIASFLVTGSVSWLYYSDRLVEFPMGVFGLALSTVILPGLSRAHAQAEVQGYNRTLDWALRWVILVSLPATVGLLALTGPMLTTLFFYGEFTPLDVTKTAYSLMAYSLGLVPFILVKVLASAFYARQDTRTPVRIGVIALVVNIVFNLMLMIPLGHAGLALATSLSAWLNAGLLLHHLRRQNAYSPLPAWRALLFKVVVAGGLMGAIVWFAAGELAAWMHWSAVERVGHLVLWVMAGLAIYAAALWGMGVRYAHLRGA